MFFVDRQEKLMNNLTKALLGSAALSALIAAPAAAQQKHPAFHVVALYAGGKAVNKTAIHHPSRSYMTWTYSVSTHIPAHLKTKTKLSDTFFKWSSQTASSSKCGNPETKNRVPNRSTYGRLGTATETRDWGCTEGPSLYYGDTYKLTNPAGEGKTDFFVSSLIGKWQWGSVKYKGTLNLHVNVAIGADRPAENSR